MKPQDLWAAAQGENAIRPLNCSAWRVVEAQHISSTRKLLDSIQEQEILEELLEAKAKPRLPQEAEFQGLHYLLSTPFRYPPLPHGSRFSTRLQRSLWYGSLAQETALAEVAFYRLLFFAGTAANLSPSEIQLTAYQTHIKTAKAVYLDQPLFDQYKTLISCTDNYQHSQHLGSNMRACEVQAFTYYSARMQDAINIGVFTPAAFAKKVPISGSQQTWLCYTDLDKIEFVRASPLKKPEHFIFDKNNFMVNNAFPFDYGAA